MGHEPLVAAATAIGEAMTSAKSVLIMANTCYY
jgi:hypothetical protein